MDNRKSRIIKFLGPIYIRLIVIRIILYKVCLKTFGYSYLVYSFRCLKIRDPQDEINNYNRHLEILREAISVSPIKLMCMETSLFLCKRLWAEGIPASLIVGCQRIPFLSHCWVEIKGDVIWSLGAKPWEFVKIVTFDPNSNYKEERPKDELETEVP